MNQPTKNKGSLAGGIAVASLLAMAFATAFAFVANSHSQQYKDCIERSDVNSNQCNKLYPHSDKCLIGYACQQGFQSLLASLRIGSPRSNQAIHHPAELPVLGWIQRLAQ